MKWSDALFWGLYTAGLLVIWQFIGWGIAYVVSGAAIMDLYPATDTTRLLQDFRAILLGIYFGELVAIIGTFGTLVKVFAEAVRDETEDIISRLLDRQPTLSPPAYGTQPQAQQVVRPKCYTLVNVGIRYCPQCGNPIPPPAPKHHDETPRKSPIESPSSKSPRYPPAYKGG